MPRSAFSGNLYQLAKNGCSSKSLLHFGILTWVLSTLMSWLRVAAGFVLAAVWVTN